jgi:hypothetical protein
MTAKGSVNYVPDSSTVLTRNTISVENMNQNSLNKIAFRRLLRLYLNDLAHWWRWRRIIK